jgi:hypothetical protein
VVVSEAFREKSEGEDYEACEICGTTSGGAMRPLTFIPGTFVHDCASKYRNKRSRAEQREQGDWRWHKQHEWIRKRDKDKNEQKRCGYLE